MPYHLIRSRMTAETWARLARRPDDRLKASKGGASDFGGEMVGYWHSTGAHDVIAVARLPDLITAAALESAIYGSGSFLDFNHTWLLSVDEMKVAVGKVDEWPSLRNYTPPGGSKEKE